MMTRRDSCCAWLRALRGTAVAVRENQCVVATRKAEMMTDKQNVRGPWNTDQQREWILNKLDEELRNVCSDHAYRRTYADGRADMLIVVATKFGLMEREALFEHINQDYDPADLKSVAAYNRLESEFGDDR